VEGNEGAGGLQLPDHLFERGEGAPGVVDVGLVGEGEVVVSLRVGWERRSGAGKSRLVAVRWRL
jgi:hypothetical protein